jgi:hypothetical protein
MTFRDSTQGSMQQPATHHGWVYAQDNPLNIIDPTEMIPTYDSVNRGAHSFSCCCGWIDWGHAGPRTARAIKDRILADIVDDDGSPDYKVIDTGYASILPPIGGLVVVRKDLSRQERQQVALGIFMSLEERVEDAQLAIEEFTFGLTRSGYSLEDLPSDLISFYVAWMTAGDITVDQLKAIVKPRCHVLDETDSLEIFEALEPTSFFYQKNRQWAPLEIPEDWCNVQGSIAEKCRDIDRSWPKEFSGVVPAPEQNDGVWWWWEGLGHGEHIYPAVQTDPSDVKGVFSYYPYGSLP